MKLICGLGNPGKEYENTRHNVGFMILDNYCKNENWSSKFNGLFIEKNINGKKIIFLKPQSYMNLSGNVVRPFRDYYKIADKDILIIRDDLDLPLGKARIKNNSSAGGDNGIKSIIEQLGNQQFYQLKVGISKNTKIDTKKYVLGKFFPEEQDILKKIIHESENIIEEFINDEILNKKDYVYGDSNETDNR